MKIQYLLACLLVFGLFSCSKDDNEPKDYNFTGSVQKGPFAQGSIVTINELNSNLSQTGLSFTANISSNTGAFAYQGISLSSSFVLGTATGFHFSEIYGSLSPAQISLQGIFDISGKSVVNINVMTHLLKDRILHLVSQGNSFKSASEQAKSELLSFLGVTSLFQDDFETLDITKNTDANATLLALSIIVQRRALLSHEIQNSAAELSWLLSQMSADFANDGLINDQNIIDTLMHNISRLNLADIRSNLEGRYSSLGQNVVIPNFEKYITVFQQKYSGIIYTVFTYPPIAAPHPSLNPNSKLPNLLVKSDLVFTKGIPLSVAAIVPFNSSVTIKLITSDPYLVFHPGNDGWVFGNQFANGFTLTSQRENELMSMRFEPGSSPGSATIEYYENSTSSPTFVKNITWQ